MPPKHPCGSPPRPERRCKDEELFRSCFQEIDKNSVMHPCILLTNFLCLSDTEKFQETNARAEWIQFEKWKIWKRSAQATYWAQKSRYVQVDVDEVQADFHDPSCFPLHSENIHSQFPHPEASRLHSNNDMRRLICKKQTKIKLKR